MAKKQAKPKQTTTREVSSTEKELKKEIDKAKKSIDAIKNANITAPMQEDNSTLDREAIMRDYEISEKHLDFVIEYMISGNKTKSYKKVYGSDISDETAMKGSWELTTRNVRVKRLIDDWKLERFNNALSVVKFEKDTVLKSLGYAAEIILKELEDETISAKDKLGYLRELNAVTKEMAKIQGMYPKEIPELPNRSDDEINTRLNRYTADYVRNLLNNGTGGVQIKQTTMTILPPSPPQTE